MGLTPIVAIAARSASPRRESVEHVARFDNDRTTVSSSVAMSLRM
jgi:hypothetical protein